MRVTVLILMTAALAAAAPWAAAGDPIFQAVPHAGGRTGGSLEDADTGADRDLDSSASFALALELRHDEGDGRYWQLWYSRQPSGIGLPGGRLDVDVEYLHVGGTVPIDESGRVHSYLAAGVGATRFTPGGIGLRERTRFSGSLGLGVAIPLSPRVALRIEARGYLTAMDTDTSIFCRSDDGQGSCLIVASGSTLFQAELLAGIAFGF